MGGTAIKKPENASPNAARANRLIVGVSSVRMKTSYIPNDDDDDNVDNFIKHRNSES